MAIQSASAALTSTIRITVVTGFQYYQIGYLDTATNTVKALSGDTSWASITDWTAFTSYSSTLQTIRWTAPLIDIGAPAYFTLTADIETDNTVILDVAVSETGFFQGEETITRIVEGDSNIESFYGRYAYVTVIVDAPEIRKFRITPNFNTVEYTINDVDTTTLSGSSSERTISLPRAVSKITDIFISPQAPIFYPVNLYVSDTATSEVLIPIILDKSNTAPQFALYGIDNDPRDGIVDIKIKALPRMALLGGKLVVIE